MRAACHVWDAAGRRVIPLATSAKAADVLGAELGRRAENLHKYLHDHGRPAGAADPWFTLRRGDVLLVDEAGMAGTLNLHRLLTAARTAGAQVRLLGDPAQLGAVEAGGALRLLVHDVGALELVELHRFTDPEEAAATLRLRAGDPAAIGFYERRGRIRAGTREGMLDAAYAAWWSDLQAGRTSLLIAATGEDAIALSARARVDRLAAGQVHPGGVGLHGGTTAGGGWVTTRANLRLVQVHGGRDFVKNGDRWTVTATHPDGALTVTHHEHHARVRLPASYVARDVELGYAVTAHRAQGATVDTAHVLLGEATTRESLYVAATRGRAGARLYTAVDTLLDPDAHPTEKPAGTPRQVLETTLRAASTTASATGTIRDRRLDAPRPAPLASRAGSSRATASLTP
jgi:hypothetical protein